MFMQMQFERGARRRRRRQPPFFWASLSTMNQSVMANLAAQGRDVRLYLMLGLANWSIFVDHIPNNAVNLLTLRNFAFCSGAEVFVFVAGYGTAIVSGKMMLERGFLVAATRVFRRTWHLYAAYVVLFVLYVDAIASVASQSTAPEIIQEYNVMGMIDHPIRVLARGLLLQARPLNLEILQLIIPLMAFFPLALWGLSRRPHVTMAASVALYLAARTFDWSLPSFPEGTWRFNPFCWQMLFVLGAWCAMTGAPGRTIQRMRWLLVPAIAYALFAATITLAKSSPALAAFVPDSLLDYFDVVDRENLSPYRLLNFIALALIFANVVPATWRGLHSRLLQPVVKCGEEWLAVFCVGVFLSFAGHFILITGPNLVAMQVFVSLAGVAAMTAVAYYVSWSKRQDHLSAARQQT